MAETGQQMTMDSAALNPILPIPMVSSIGAAVRMLRAEWRQLFKIIAVPSLVIALADAAVPSHLHADKNIAGALHSLLIFVINFMLQPWLMVAGLRFLVLGEPPRWAWPYYEPRWLRYLWKSIVIWFALIAPVVVLGLAALFILPQIWAVILILGLMLFASVASGRILLALPASAIDDNDSLRAAWDKTRGQALRILTIKFLAQLALCMPFLLAALAGFAVANISPFSGKFLTIWLIEILQLLLLLPVDALLYGYFYRGMIIHRTEPNESSNENHGN